tara:strand:- start:427 stop:1128 length:702 start_codon:yes stop_codon:yes gene_type:complete
MKTAAIIFSRLSSKRLKNKALIKINNCYLVELVIKRAKLLKNIDEIIVATSTKEEDKKIVKIAKKNNVKFYCGSLNNLVNRAISCCDKHHIDAFVRICGDRPLFDIELIESALNTYKKNKRSIDFISSEINFKSIPGLVTELLTYRALLKLKSKKLSKFNAEHITSFIYENMDSFKTKKLKSKFKYNGIKLTVDYIEDKERISYILNSNYPNYYLDTKKNLLKAEKWYQNLRK